MTLRYHFEENQKGSPCIVDDLKPIQMPKMDMVALVKPVRPQMVVMGDMSLGGTITAVSNLAESP